MQNEAEKLTRELKAQGIRIGEVAFENDPWGYASLRVSFEISIDEPDEEDRQLMAIIREVMPYFLADETLQRLFVQITIYDDKVAVEPYAYERDDLLGWYSGQMDYETLRERQIGYWHSEYELIARADTAYVFGVCVRGDSVVGLQRDAKWYLPGGMVKGQNTPLEIQDARPQNAIKWYVQQQTGLDVVGWSRGHVLEGKHAPPGESVIVLYHVFVDGELTAGTLMPVDDLPIFTPEYGDPRDFVRWTFENFQKNQSINARHEAATRKGLKH